MDVQAIIDKHYTRGTRLYDIFMSHATDVTNKALSIVQNHPELAVDTRFIEEAALLHDIGIYLTRAPHIGCKGRYPYICHGYLGQELLTVEGYPKHGLVCRHTGTTLASKALFKGSCRYLTGICGRKAWRRRSSVSLINFIPNRPQARRSLSRRSGWGLNGTGGTR